LEFLAPYERFIGAAFIHALKPASPLGIFSHRAQELRHRYVGFVQELMEESFPRQKQNPLAFLAPDVFWIYYLGALLYWLHDSSPDKQNTLAFLEDRKSTRLNSSHVSISYAVFCLKKKNNKQC